MSSTTCLISGQDMNIFLGIIGISMMQEGMARSQFADSTLLKNFIQLSLGLVSWWLLGFGFAFGDVDGDFAGNQYFGGEDMFEDVVQACGSHWGLIGILTLLLINGSLMQKTQLIVYQALSIIYMSFVYPIITAWFYGQGWLYDLDRPLMDGPGAISLYLTAGTVALVGLAVMGKRQEGDLRMNSMGSYVFGGILLIQFILYQNGVVINPDQDSEGSSSQAYGNSLIAGSVTCLFGLKLLTLKEKDPERHVLILVQGFIAGMISVSDSAYNIQTWEGFLIGILGGGIFVLGNKILDWLKLDDPMKIFPTFFLPGMFGGIFSGLFDHDFGLFYEDGELLGSQLQGILAVLGWATIFSIVVFLPMKVFKIGVLSDQLKENGTMEAKIGQMGYFH